MDDDLTKDELQEIIHYDRWGGGFVWLVDQLRCKAGDVAGFSGAKGYWQIRISGKLYYAHRLAFFYMRGGWPANIDHIDGDRCNNKWANLREASIQQNAANMRKRLGTTSTLKGVSWMASKGRWASHIRINGKSTYLGLFDDESSAHAAYVSAAGKEFGEFARAK